MSHAHSIIVEANNPSLSARTRHTRTDAETSVSTCERVTRSSSLKKSKVSLAASTSETILSKNLKRTLSKSTRTSPKILERIGHVGDKQVNNNRQKQNNHNAAPEVIYAEDKNVKRTRFDSIRTRTRPLIFQKPWQILQQYSLNNQNREEETESNPNGTENTTSKNEEVLTNILGYVEAETKTPEQSKLAASKQRDPEIVDVQAVKLEEICNILRGVMDASTE
ncbi:hypothetical protein HK100_005089, partial [Physocladia obscura]